MMEAGRPTAFRDRARGCSGLIMPGVTHALRQVLGLLGSGRLARRVHLAALILVGLLSLA